jgi:hypothetical protein
VSVLGRKGSKGILSLLLLQGHALVVEVVVVVVFTVDFPCLIWCVCGALVDRCLFVRQCTGDREEREKTQNNSSSAVFVAAAAEAINKEQQQEETRFDLESWCAARSSIAGVQNLLNIDDNNNDNSNALPKATCNNKRSHVLSSSSRDQSCGGHNIAAAGATMVEPMTPTIERGGSRGGSHQQHKGARGRISSPCAAVTYPREGEKAANLTPPVVAAATAVHHKKPWGGSSSGCVKRAVSQRESHIWSERQRRKGMNHLFSTLRSLLPQPSSKVRKLQDWVSSPVEDWVLGIVSCR